MAIYTVPARVDLRGAREDLKQFQRIGAESGEKTAAELTKALRTEFTRQSEACDKTKYSVLLYSGDKPVADVRQ